MRRRIRITYDVRMLGFSGIGTHVENVLRGLAARPDVQLSLIGNGERIRACVPDFDGQIHNWSAAIYSLREQIAFPPPERDGVLLLPHYNAPVRFLDRAVVVLHDLIHLYSPEFRAPHYRLYAQIMLGQVARRARRILTVSNYTREDFISRFPRGTARTIVNPNGIDHALLRPQSPKAVRDFRVHLQLPKRFILCMGIGKRHKNVDFVIRALLPHWQAGKYRIPLVLGGSGGELPAYIREAFPAADLAHVQAVPRLPAAELPLLYAAAEALVMPSLMEGFGFPVAEAMACGTPVVSSSAASLPEVGGEAALYFDPRDPQSFTDQLFRLTSDSKMHVRLSGSGIKQAARFRWENHVERLLQVLSELEAEE